LTKLADRHFVLEKGRTVWSGSSTELREQAARVKGWIGV
jgi:branched-chain amino acid transport system ATP-binding protein